MNVKLGIPSKGRLMDKTFDWFKGRGVELARSGSEREYSAEIRGGSGIRLVLLSAGEIPREFAAGRIQIGVTGADLIREKLINWRTIVEPIAELGFGYANLVIAVPSCWVDVDTLDDFDAVAASFRNKHGFRLRIASKYHRLVREFLKNNGVADYQIVDSQGATEGTVKNHTAEAIADITSSGQTLKANHLKILKDGLVLKSQATLFCAQKHIVDREQFAVITRFIKDLGV